MNQNRLIFAAVVLLSAFILLTPGSAATDLSLPWPLEYHQISASFGEYRFSHLHLGIDIRTFGKNLPIKAPLDGYVERFKAERTGYGKVLYLRLNSGHTLVLAHLEKFFPELNDYLKQLRTSSNRLYPHEKFFSSTDFPVTAGMVVGYTGESGSGPPHLHYEIRRGLTVINPLKYLKLKDSIKPVIKDLYFVGDSVDFRVNGVPFSHYLPWNDENNVQLTSPFNLSVVTYDKQGPDNFLGVYEINSSDSQFNSWKFDQVSLKDNHYRKQAEAVYHQQLTSFNQGSYHYWLSSPHQPVRLDSSREMILKIADFSENTVEGKINLLAVELLKLDWSIIKDESPNSFMIETSIDLSDFDIKAEITQNDGQTFIPIQFELISSQTIRLHSSFPAVASAACRISLKDLTGKYLIDPLIITPEVVVGTRVEESENFKEFPQIRLFGFADGIGLGIKAAVNPLAINLYRNYQNELIFANPVWFSSGELMFSIPISKSDQTLNREFELELRSPGRREILPVISGSGTGSKKLQSYQLGEFGFEIQSVEYFDSDWSIMQLPHDFIRFGLPNNCRLLSSGLLVGPAELKCKINITWNSSVRIDPRAALFRVNQRSISYIPSKLLSGTGQSLQSEINSFGEYAVILDEQPPSIESLSKLNSASSFFKFKVADVGSGIDYNSIKVLLNGKVLDYDNGNYLHTSRIEFGEIKSKSENKLRIQVADRVGNLTIRNFVF